MVIKAYPLDATDADNLRSLYFQSRGPIGPFGEAASTKYALTKAASKKAALTQAASQKTAPSNAASKRADLMHAASQKTAPLDAPSRKETSKKAA